MTTFTMALYTNTPVPTVFANEDEWRAARSTFVGGSEVAALMGLSPWADAWKVYGQKTGLVPPLEDNQKLRLGRRMEKVIADEYELLTGRKVRRVENTVYRHPELPELGASPDCLCIEEERGVEFKNVGQYAMDGWGDEGSDQIPTHYLIQVQTYLEVLNLPVWDVAAMMAGQEVRLYTVERNTTLGAEIRRVVKTFWGDHIATGNPPPVDASDTASLWLKEKFPKNRTPLRVAEPHEAKLLEDLRDVRAALAKLENREKELTNLLKLAIGEAEGFTAECGSVTWKERSGRQSTDWEALVEAQKIPPQVVERYTKVAPATRYFLPNFKKGAK